MQDGPKLDDLRRRLAVGGQVAAVPADATDPKQERVADNVVHHVCDTVWISHDSRHDSNKFMVHVRPHAHSEHKDNINYNGISLCMITYPLQGTYGMRP